ncbi:MAG: hypothetical protein LBS59_01150 [Puniceicoccales bacterium]|jgi:hypothetical protein|nr:hypothetical protein [Puniceicoccales bacterium]
MNTEPASDLLDQHIDSLLATHTLSPPPLLVEKTLLAIAEDDKRVDAVLDARLRHLPLPPRADRAEKFFRAALHAVQFTKILRWSVSTITAAAVLIFALHFPSHTKYTPEEILAKAIADDPALDSLLQPAEPVILDHETVQAISGLNNNALAWLETLTTFYED